jgi:hypothetical protein
VVEHVELSSVHVDGRADVWDVSVADVHEFFAGGLLVHNCVQGLAAGLFPEAVTSGMPGSTTLHTVADEHIQYAPQTAVVPARGWR